MPVPAETPYGPVAAVADWLHANGIDPDDVPIEGPITIEHGRIRYATLLRNKAGHRYQDPATGKAAREERTAPLTVEPPANVRVGWEGYMPEPWTMDHQLHVLIQAEARTGQPNDEGERWVERRVTGKAIAVCSCGYTSGLVDSSSLPPVEELAAEHPRA